MRESLGCQRLWVVVAVVLSQAAAARAEPYHSPQYGYGLTIPSTWTRIPADVVKQATDMLQKPGAGNALIFDAGFQPTGGSHWLAYPYVFVQVIPYSLFGSTRQIHEDEFGAVINKLTGSQVEKALDDRMSSDVRSLVKGIDLGKPTLDTAAHRYVMNTKANVAGIGSVRGRVVGYFGHDSLVQVCFYAQEADWDKDIAAGESLANSLVFDPAKAYSVAEAKATARNDFWKNVGSKATGGAIIGGLIALVISMVRKSKSPALRPPNLPR